MSQLPITYPPFSRPGTSLAAADSIASKASTLRDQVYADIVRAGSHGATDAEMQQRMNLSGDTQRPRRWELERAGLVMDSGRRRQSPSGRDQIVWVAR